MNYNIVGQIRNRKKDGELMGTCFLISPTYVLTAGHVLKDIDNIKDLDIIFKFMNIKNTIKEKIYVNHDDIDFVILKLNNEIEKDIEYSEIYATVALEKDDNWESVGYPEDNKRDLVNIDNKYSYVDGKIIREIENERCDYELTINHQKQITDWKGLSGAPLIMNNKIVGIISSEFKSKLIKTKIKAVSIQKIVEFLLEENETDVLKILSYRCNNLLNTRADEFNELCKEKFFNFQYKTIDFTSDCLVVKKNYKIEDIVELIDVFLTDYANQLEDLILLEHKSLRVRRRQQKIVEEVKNELKQQLIKDNKISLALLWIILEGMYKIPRLASTYSLINENLKQDIYISNTDSGIKLLIGYAQMKQNILDSIKEILNEVNKEKLAEKDQNRIIIWDELAINCLDIATKLQIEKIKNEKIELEIVLLHSYDSKIYTGIQYKRDGNNNQLIKELIKRELNEYNCEIIRVCSQFEWIKNVKINWISLPIESISSFNRVLL